MRSMMPSAAVRSGFAGLLFGVLSALGCGGDHLLPSPPDMNPDAIGDVYWALRLNHKAALMSTVAPYDTLTIVAVPLNVEGKPIEGVPAPTYTSAAPDVIDVTSDGVIRARSIGSKVKITASLTVDGITHQDFLFVDIVNLATPPVLTGFSMQPVPPDSAKRALVPFPVGMTLLARATDAHGNPMTVPVFYSSSDSAFFPVDRTTGRLSQPPRAGDVTFYASTVAFGVAKVDSLPFRVGLPLIAPIALIRKNYLSGVKLLFEPAEMRVDVGATIRWSNTAKVEGADIIFTDPTNVIEGIPVPPIPPCAAPTDCGRGNITNLIIDQSLFFPLHSAERGIYVPGVYEYYSPQIGAGGRIIVVDSNQ